MKTGIVNSAYYSEKLGGVDYKTMRAHGYSCADYQYLTDTKNSVFYHTDEDTFAEMLTEERKRAEDAGIAFSQVHAPWPTDDLTPESRAVKLEYMKKAVRGCAHLHGGYLVVHPVMPFGWGEDKDPAFTVECNRELFTQLCHYGAEFGVGICVENMPFAGYGLSKIPALTEFVRELNLPDFFLCLDTGHVNVFGQDCGEAVRVCRDCLRVLHVHDNDGKGDRHLLPYEGCINWESFRAALGEIGFSGVLSLETRISRPYPEPLLTYHRIGLAKTADYLASKPEK